MESLTGTVLGRYDGRDSLRIFRNGSTVEFVSIDRTHYGPEWCRNHDMKVTDIVEADNGEKFEIWRLEGKYVCAIPVKT